MYSRVYLSLYRIAAYSKKHLETGRTYHDKIPKYSNIAMLLAVESYEWLLELERFNFNVLEPNLQKLSTFTIPRKMLKQGQAGLY